MISRPTAIFKIAEKVSFNEKTKECTFYYDSFQYKLVFEFKQSDIIEFRLLNLSTIETFIILVDKAIFHEVIHSQIVAWKDKLANAIEQMLKRRQFGITPRTRIGKITLGFRRKVEEEVLELDIDLRKFDHLAPSTDVYTPHRTASIGNSISSKMDLILKEFKSLDQDFDGIKEDKKALHSLIFEASEEVRDIDAEQFEELRQEIDIAV